MEGVVEVVGFAGLDGLGPSCDRNLDFELFVLEPGRRDSHLIEIDLLLSLLLLLLLLLIGILILINHDVLLALCDARRRDQLGLS